MSLHSLLKTLFYRAGYSIKKLQPAALPLEVATERAEGDPLALLHAVSPYEGFDFQRYPNDPSGWGSQSPVFGELLARLRPELVVEVGTWKGGSALHMAAELERLGLPTRILCIDTWLGALEFWQRQKFPERHAALELVNGYPSVYYQFLANVCHAGQQARILPFPQTSALGALWLRCHGVQAGLVYIDASHEEEDVYADLLGYWEVVLPGGILLGDDWEWDGVRLAAERFAREHGLAIHRGGEKWWVEKPH